MSVVGSQRLALALKRFPRVHLVGIGGVGMSGIAEVLITLGFTVSGSDARASATTERLASRGARIVIGHDPEQLGAAQVVVRSSAIADDNAELQAARKRGLPVLPRAEMLGELMRFKQGVAVAGTHGKTTTTSLIAHVLGAAGLDPTYVIGGRLNASGIHAALGQGELLVAEADESDGSFLLLNPLLAVITNVDNDHLIAFDGRRERLEAAFVEFVHRLPFFGVAVLCVDDPFLASLALEHPRATVSYGFAEHADVRAVDVRAVGLAMHFRLEIRGQYQADVKLNLAGRHNVQNALAALAVARELGADLTAAVEGLADFAGVGRRFVHRSMELAGRRVELVDDYGHHPTEVRAVLDAARGAWPDRRLVLAFQPHRYTRTRDCFEDFAQVLSEPDQVLIGEVYAAGEAPLAGADGRALCRAVRSRGRLDPVFFDQAQALPTLLADVVADGDVVLLMGAGDIGQISARLRAEARP